MQEKANRDEFKMYRREYHAVNMGICSNTLLLLWWSFALLALLRRTFTPNRTSAIKTSFFFKGAEYLQVLNSSRDFILDREAISVKETSSLVQVSLSFLTN